jgi:hypothetical protein
MNTLISGWKRQHARASHGARQTAMLAYWIGTSTSGLYDIHYDPRDVKLNGSDYYSLDTIIEEVTHAEQFLRLWSSLEPPPWRSKDTASYGTAKLHWKAVYLLFSIEAAPNFYEDNMIEEGAKDKVKVIVATLRATAAFTKQSQVCGFNLYP